MSKRQRLDAADDSAAGPDNDASQEDYVVTSRECSECGTVCFGPEIHQDDHFQGEAFFCTACWEAFDEAGEEGEEEDTTTKGATHYLASHVAAQLEEEAEGYSDLEQEDWEEEQEQAATTGTSDGAAPFSVPFDAQAMSAPMATEDAIRSIVLPEDLEKDKAWWRCKSCTAYVHSEMHQPGCKHSHVIACSVADVVNTNRWQSVYDPNPRARHRAGIEVLCKDCKEPFIFTEREQKFFASKGFTTAPVRCVSCRRGNKLVKEQRAEERQKRKEEGNVKFGGPDGKTAFSWAALAQQQKESMGITADSQRKAVDLPNVGKRPHGSFGRAHTAKAVQHLRGSQNPADFPKTRNTA